MKVPAAKIDFSEADRRQILSLIDKYQGIERVRERARAFTDKARQVIGEFPESAYQRALYGITDLITDRDH